MGGGVVWSAQPVFRTNQAFVDLFVHRVTCYWIVNAITLGLAESECVTVRSTVNKGRSSWSGGWMLVSGLTARAETGSELQVAARPVFSNDPGSVPPEKKMQKCSLVLLP